MKTDQAFDRRRAVAGIIAAIILFAMLFTVGAGYFLFVNQGALNTNQANATRQNAVQQANLEKLAMKVVLAKGSTSNIVLTLNNTGGVPVTIVGFFVNDGTGKLLPPGVISLPFVVGSPRTNLTTSKFVLDVGASTRTLPGCIHGKIGCNIDLAGGNSTATVTTLGTCPSTTGYCYVSGIVQIGVITGRGNVFSVQFPPTPANTVTVATVNSYGCYQCTTVVGTSTSTVSSTTLPGAAGEALVTRFAAGPSPIDQGLTPCTPAGCILVNVTVYDYSSVQVTGVLPTLYTPVVTGTASVTASNSGTGHGGVSCAAPTAQTLLPNGGSFVYHYCYVPSTGDTGGTATFSGYAKGTLSGTLINSASATSNSIQIGGFAGALTGIGPWGINYFFFKYTSTTQTTPANAGTISAGSNKYVDYQVQVDNNFNSSMTILDYSYLQLVRTGPEINFYMIASATYSGTTGTINAYTAAQSGSQGSYTCAPTAMCQVVPAGGAYTMNFAATAYGGTTWQWPGTNPGLTPVEGDSILVVIVYLVTLDGHVYLYAQALPFEGETVLT